MLALFPYGERNAQSNPAPPGVIFAKNDAGIELLDFTRPTVKASATRSTTTPPRRTPRPVPSRTATSVCAPDYFTCHGGTIPLIRAYAINCPKCSAR
jgi:hypothetical protein